VSYLDALDADSPRLPLGVDPDVITPTSTPWPCSESSPVHLFLG